MKNSTLIETCSCIPDPVGPSSKILLFSSLMSSLGESSTSPPRFSWGICWFICCCIDAPKALPCGLIPAICSSSEENSNSTVWAPTRSVTTLNTQEQLGTPANLEFSLYRSLQRGNPQKCSTIITQTRAPIVLLQRHIEKEFPMAQGIT